MSLTYHFVLSATDPALLIVQQSSEYRLLLFLFYLLPK